jgi:hypothetical protein
VLIVVGDKRPTMDAQLDLNFLDSVLLPFGIFKHWVFFFSIFLGVECEIEGLREVWEVL